jgi:hypothetical protein
VRFAQKFLGKAFQRRQELLLRYLLAHGCSPECIAGVRLSELLEMQLGREGASLRNLYLFILRRIRPDIEEEALAFTTLEGMPMDSLDLKSYLRKIAAVRRNAEFNGSSVEVF